MKYLKKIFESNKSVDNSTLQDILLEITDLGYLTRVESVWWADPEKPERSSYISICIYGRKARFKDAHSGFDMDHYYLYRDEIMEVVDKLIEYLSTEDYNLVEDGKKIIDVIKNKIPTKKTKDEINIKTSQYGQITLEWDDSIKGYKIGNAVSLEFRKL